MTSKHSSRWLHRTLALALGLAVLLAMAVLVGPRLLDLPSVRARLERQLSEATKGELTWKKLDVRLLPAPHGVLSDAQIRIPGVVEGRVEEIEIRLRLVALLAGRVELQEAHVVRPVLRVTVPHSDRTRSAEPVDPITAYRNAAQPIVDRIRRLAPDLELSVQDGKFEVSIPGLPSAVQINLTAEGRSDAQGFTLTASATGELWESLKATARLEYETLASHIEIHGAGLKPQMLIDHYLAGAVVGIAAPSGTAQAQLDTDGQSTLTARLLADVPALTVVRNGTSVELFAAHVEAVAAASAREIELMLHAMRLGEVLPRASGRLRYSAADGGAVEMSIEVPALDLTRLRAVATTLAEDEPLVQRYVGRVRAGHVSDLRVAAQGPSLRALADPAALNASLKVAGGGMLVPYLEQVVDDISGTLEWGNGVVRAREVAGRLGRTRVANGSLEYRLGEKQLRIEGGYDLDLTQGLEVAQGLPHVPRTALDVVRGVRGRAEGRLAVSHGPGGWKVDVAVNRSDSVLSFRGLPWPARLREGNIAVRSKRVSIDAAGGSIGASTFESVAVALPTGVPLRIEAARGSASLALPELYAWARGQNGIAEKLTAIGGVEGNIDVTLNRLTGQADRLDALDYDASLRPRQVRAQVSGLPAPLLLDGGSLNVTRQALRFDSLGTALLDARAKVSGIVRDFTAQTRKVNASLAEGETGEQFMTWAYGRSGAPAYLQPNAPLRFAAQRVQWSGAGGLDLRAEAQLAAGPLVEADVAWKPGSVEVRSGHIKDQESDATLGMALRGRILDVRFAGVLTGRTVDRLFAKSLAARQGRVEGDFRATLDRDMRGRSDARGRLSGYQLRLDELLGRPLTLERIDLDSDGARLRVKEAAIVYAGQKATLVGEIWRGTSGLVIDARIDTAGFVLDALLPPPEPSPASPPPPPRKAPEALAIWPLPLEGTLGLNAGFLEYRGYRVEPVVARLDVEAERARLHLTDAMLCGIRFPLTLEGTPEGWSASAQLLAKKQQLESTAQCLSDQRVMLTGEFDLFADLRTNGAIGQLWRNLEGVVQGEARNGKVMKWPLLGNILSLKNIGAVLQGDVRLGAEGFEYRSMLVRGHIASGRFEVKEAAFDSSAVGLAATGSVGLENRDANLTVLVAPFSGIDRLVRRIPVVGYILGGNLTSVPVKVTGDIRDPAVVPLDPRAITTELVGIFERTLKLPKRLLAPLQGTPKPAGATR